MAAVKCRVKGVYMAQGAMGASPAVILSMDDETCLPIYIGLWEAMSINSAIQKEVPPRPLTHDLFIDLLERCKVTMRAIVIDSLQDGVYYANLILDQDRHEVTLDCRPSDGIAIGVRCNAEIFIDEQVKADSAVPSEELPALMDITSYLGG
jgi:bifunctional DNase/RNase